MKTALFALALTVAASSASAFGVAPFFPTLTFPEASTDLSTQGPSQPLILFPEAE